MINWKKYYSGASGLFSVVIYSKNRNSVYKFVNSLKLFGIGQSWGGFESLVLYQNHNIQRVYKKYIKATSSYSKISYRFRGSKRS